MAFLSTPAVCRQLFRGLPQRSTALHVHSNIAAHHRAHTRRPTVADVTMTTGPADHSILPNAKQVRCQHIIVDSEEMAQALKVQVQDGADFGALASSLSTCDTKRFNGHLGWVQPGQMVTEFEEAVFSAPQNALIVTQSPFGWHLVEILDVDDSPFPRTIGIRQFSNKYADPQARATVQLVDIREVDEQEKARLDGFASLPMSQYREWSDSFLAGEILDLDTETIILCHKGNRSEHMCEFLGQLGLQRPRSLVGGIDLYAKEIDSSIPRY